MFYCFLVEKKLNWTRYTCQTHLVVMSYYQASVAICRFKPFLRSTGPSPHPLKLKPPPLLYICQFTFAPCYCGLLWSKRLLFFSQWAGHMRAWLEVWGTWPFQKMHFWTLIKELVFLRKHMYIIYTYWTKFHGFSSFQLKELHKLLDFFF